MAMTCLSAAQAKDYNIVSYGAKNDTTILSTAALQQAIDDFTTALQYEPNLAEAYFNRGICHLNKGGEKEKASADLSKAGELGLYDAYSVLKRNVRISAP